MKQKKIKKSLLKYFTAQLQNDGIVYFIEKIEGDSEYVYICSSLNAISFRYYLERALCQKESEELHSGRPVISYREYRERKYPNSGCFHILSSDAEKFAASYC